jgi:hypothetical protein
MNEEKFFYKLKTRSEFIQKYAHEQIIEKKNKFVYYHGFKAIRIDKIIWHQEPILKRIDEYFPIANVGLLIIDPFKCYKWHVDAERKFALNLLLDGFDTSYSIFSDNYKESSLQADILHLKYDKNYFYAFNTKVYHTVFNLNEKRHLISVEFLLNTKYSYDDFLNYCLSNNL